MTNRLIRAAPVAALLAVGVVVPAAAATINGTSGPDVLRGTDRADTIRGFAGNDVLRGRRGADQLYGGSGADRLYGGTDWKRDRLYGRAGPDRIVAYSVDSVYAGAGNDTIVLVLPHAHRMYTIVTDCGRGKDLVIVRGNILPVGGNPRSCERIVGD